MRTAARRIARFAAGLAVLAALPFAGRAFRGDRGGLCDLDGVVIEPTWRVRSVDGRGAPRQFCCVDCAQRWTERAHDSPREIFVTDESTGRETRADDAWFVRSSVVSFATTGSRIHVFAREADARRHAEAFRGAILEGDERPFRRQE